uniref:DUF3108 domain-containing protein n=1 Tax=candidate division WOR-3 bacterium TaxID=2052148 RepID=A0A7C4CC53_UNCW3
MLEQSGSRAWLAAGLLLLLIACGPAPRSPMPELITPQWQDGETSRYEVVRADSVLFERVIQLRFDEESGTPSIIVTSVVRPQQAEVALYDSAVFELRRFSLKPLWSYRVVTTDLSALEVEVRYEPGAVEVEKQFIEGTDRQVLKVGRDAFGAEMLPFLLRAVRLTPGTSFTVSAVAGLEMRVVSTDVAVLGTRLVKTGLGDILCREVELRSPPRNVSLLYELAEPHRLVAIEDPDNKSVTRLVGYSAASPDLPASGLP